MIGNPIEFSKTSSCTFSLCITSSSGSAHHYRDHQHCCRRVKNLFAWEKASCCWYCCCYILWLCEANWKEVLTTLPFVFIPFDDWLTDRPSYQHEGVARESGAVCWYLAWHNCGINRQQGRAEPSRASRAAATGQLISNAKPMPTQSLIQSVTQAGSHSVTQSVIQAIA